MSATPIRSNQTVPAQPPALPGFENIKRWWDRSCKQYTARILPGEYYVSREDELITTVLGSCVSACIRDPLIGIGGMNHFMLPHGTGIGNTAGNNAATRYGSFAMEHLINDILKQGGKRERLEIKLFGGGNVLAGMTDIGKRNIAFVREYLHTETLPVISEDLGGTHPRKVNYFPGTGKVMLKKLRRTSDKIIQREENYLHTLEETPVAGEIDLF